MSQPTLSSQHLTAVNYEKMADRHATTNGMPSTYNRRRRWLSILASLVILFSAASCAAALLIRNISPSNDAQRLHAPLLLLDSPSSIDRLWEEFKMRHEKSYATDTEEYKRKAIFSDNLVVIDRHNRQYAAGVHSFSMHLNHLADWTNDEVRTTLNGYRPLLMSTGRAQNDAIRSLFLRPLSVSIEHLPKTVDWRKKNLVTPVKNQGHCGSCWAFSTTGSLEGQHARKKNKLVSLSEQNLVDCSSKFGNNGCNGGLMDNAFAYIKANGGIDTEKSYPYDGQDEKCRYKNSTIGAEDTGFVDIKEGNETDLQIATATVGPISIAIDASQFSFQFYSGGVYADASCSSTELDHGVLIVGYGKENGKKYWLVKNSWGPMWGDSGYIKIAKDDGNMCGVATKASYPIV